MDALVLMLSLAQVATPASTVPSRATSVPPAPPSAAEPQRPSPASTPAPAAKLGGGFGQKPTTLRKARVVITDESMEVPKGPGTFTVSGAPGSSPNPPTSPGAGAPASASDEEATWRSRAAKLRADLAQAQKDYDAADRANTVVSFGRPGHDYETLLAIRNAALAPYVMRLEEVQTALAALPEECRRAHGCQPGWVR